MGDALKMNRFSSTKRLGAAAAAIVGLLAWGCASSGNEQTAQASPPRATSTAAKAVTSPAPAVAEIARVDVSEMAPGARVTIDSSAPLVWTTYRDGDGNLVLDLPNARLGAGVTDRLYGKGIVSSIRVSSVGVPSRPIARLVIATRESAEHRLDARGSALQVDLVPSGREFPSAAQVAQAPRPAAPATISASAPAAGLPAPAVSAPAPAPVVAARPAPAPSASAPAPVVASRPASAPAAQIATAAQLAAGTPDEPLQAPAPTGVAATRLSSIERIGEGTVRIAGDGEFAYSTFRLENPERFVIDLDGVLNRSDRGTLAISEKTLSRVRVSQFKAQPAPVARVVFDLTTPTVPAIERTSAGLVVRFGAEPVAAAEKAAETAPAPAAAPAVAEKSMAPAAPAPQAPAAAIAVEPVAPEQRAPAVVASAPAVPAPAPPSIAPAPPVAAATSDVTAFEPTSAATPAPSKPGVAAFEAQDVQPAAAPEPGVPRLTQAVIAGQTALSAKKEYTGEPISMSLKDADVREVLRTFARLSGLNIVIQPGVRGTVTVELEKVPWDQALDQILKINGLGYELEGNIMRIAPLAVLQAEAKRSQALAAAQAMSLPLQTIVKRLSYSSAGDIAGLLRRGGGGIMSQRGSVIVDGRTNTLIIKELPNYLDTVLAVIDTLDTPEPQVVIEARIVETTKQFSRTLGIRWGFNGVADQAHGNTTGLEFPYHGNTNGGVSLLTGGANGFIDMTLGNILDTFTLNARLQVAESEGLINVLSAPKVVTLNNNAAEIQSGTQIPIQTSANNTTSVQFVNATLRLQVTPHVTAEGTVMLDINVQKREPLFALQVAGAPSAPISTKEAKTRVIVRDGGTTVIGGIYKVSTDAGVDRVPGLANVPLLGNLFKNRRSRHDNDELLIFITPRVVKL
jgi:type IV pilus assembly protein PilQ